MELELKGKSHRSVIVDGPNIRIVKEKSMFSSGREKVLPIRKITSVEVKKPGAVWAGFIQFSIAGGQAKNSSFTISGGTFDAAGDENSVLFTDQASYEIALKIKEYIGSYSDTSHEKVDSSPADEIRKLKALLNDGILTEEEFNKKKQQLLGI